MARPIIEVHNLVKAYGQHVAVNNVSFAVQAGEIFGLLGPTELERLPLYRCYRLAFPRSRSDYHLRL